MVLDALGIEFGLFLGHAQLEQELEHYLVSTLALLRQPPPGDCQFNRAVRLGLNQPRRYEPGDRAADGHMAYPHHLRKIPDPGLATLGDQFCDGLDIVLGDLIPMIGPRPPEPLSTRSERAITTLSAPGFLIIFHKRISIHGPCGFIARKRSKPIP